MNTIITISQQQGCSGELIGRRVSEELGIPFYDQEITDLAAKRSELHRSCFISCERHNAVSLGYSFVPGVQFELPLESKVYLAQRSAILELASHGACVIFGHGACEVLKERKSLVRIYLYGNIEERILHVQDQCPEQARTIERRIRRFDRRKMIYYSFYEERPSPGQPHFDLCIDSSKIELEQVIRIILAACP